MTLPALLAAFLAVGSASSATSPWTDNRPLADGAVRVVTEKVQAGHVVELAVDLAATFANPFDPRQVTLDAEVTGPGGVRILQPGFFMIPYTRSGEGVVLAPKSEWRARFTPPAAGQWRVTVRVKDRTGEAAAKPVNVAVAPSDAPGMIRVSPRDGRYFEFASGKPYFPVGLNVCWADDHGLSDYDAWFGALGKSGGTGRGCG